jgi:hypothetical protein
MKHAVRPIMAKTRIGGLFSQPDRFERATVRGEQVRLMFGLVTVRARLRADMGDVGRIV